MQPFDFHRPPSVDDALAALRGAADGKFLAGGQSLLPVMKLDMAAPSDLVSLAGVEELRGIREDGGAVVVGALSTHAEVERSSVVRKAIPALEKEVIILRDNVAEYVQILPDDREVNDFVTKINQFADQAGVVVTTLEDVVRRDTKKKNPFERVAYRLNLTGDIDEVLSFMNYFENHERFVKIPSFTVKAGKKNRDQRTADVKHKVDLLLETFVYNQAGSGLARVNIPDYETKRENLEEEIVAARADVSIEKYTFAANDNRRDPFLDPRMSADDAQALTLAKEQKRLGELVAALDAIDGWLEAEAAETDLIRKSELRGQVDEAIRALAMQVDVARSEEWFSIATIRDSFESDVVERLAVILSERGLDPNASLLTVQDLEEVRDHMATLFDEGSYPQVVQEFEGLATRIDPAEQSHEFHAVLEDVTRLRDHSVAILEFQDRDIRIEGIVYRPGASSVIINGLVLEEGDPIDDEVRIASIHEDQIEFAFREIVIGKLVHH